MPQVLIRDLDDETLRKLKKRAAENRRSLQRELHLILSQAAVTAKEAGAKRMGKGALAAKRRGAPTGSVWNWLRRPSVGDLTKDDIDSYIEAERESWGAP